MSPNKPSYELLEQANNAKHLFNKQLSEKLKEKIDENMELRLHILHLEDEKSRARVFKTPSLFTRLKILFTGEF